MENNKLFKVRSSPFIHSGNSTRKIMLEVIIALLPALIFSVYTFGLRVITIVAVSVTCAVLSEYFFEKLLKKPITVSDFSAALTGLLLAMNLPVSVPLWLPALGAIFAIVIVKQLFGGLGKNIVNPALAARVFLVMSFADDMTNFTLPAKSGLFTLSADALATATPLSTLKTGGVANISAFDLILGNKAGCIGEVSCFLLIVGGIFLILRKDITWHIPISFIGTVFIITMLLPKTAGMSYEYCLQQVFSGGLILGAFFMATDYVTSPLTSKGRIIYGIGCGLITVFIRYFGGFNEGVSFAILIMNLMVYYIDRFTKPKVFGGSNAKG